MPVPKFGSVTVAPSTVTVLPLCQPEVLVRSAELMLSPEPSASAVLVVVVNVLVAVLFRQLLVVSIAHVSAGAVRGRSTPAWNAEELGCLAAKAWTPVASTARVDSTWA
ncbi:hypothetical protein [Streptomyces murinus]|uniref:hypothetical protein n=1 Tax=Streptomyces murinus TaxID=33900 RepID=UPI003F45621D